MGKMPWQAEVTRGSGHAHTGDHAHTAWVGETEAAAGDCDPEWRGEHGGGGSRGRARCEGGGGPGGGTLAPVRAG